MLDFILFISLVSLTCCGFHFVTRSGWVLDFIDTWLIEILGGRITYSFDEYGNQTMNPNLSYWAEYAYKPLLGCVVCMGSVWGVISFTLFTLLISPLSWFLLPVFCICVSAMNGIIYFNLLKHWE